MATDDADALPAGMPRPGETVDGKYSLVRVIGAGGMGVVFEAEHLRLKQRCAIKMLSPEMLREGDIVHRFEREARASALLRSPHVTRVTDVATTPEGVPYIVMELLTGRDLDALLTARGLVPFAEAVDYVLQACAAVAEAHAAGIIHRDLKPGNLFLAQDDDGQLVKVLDFGISKMIEDESKLTSAGMTMGTALYMSPEQLRSASTVDARSDIWSLGIILYELVCGAPPFVGSATQIAAAIVSEDAPDITGRSPIPPELAAAIHRAMKRNPAERFQNVTAFAGALAPFAPVDSIGRAVAAQLSRRGSSRSMVAVSDPGSDPRVHAGVDVDARTIHDVSTSAPHAMNTAARNDSTSRRLLVAALAVVALVAMLGLGAVAFRIFRRDTPAPVPATVAGSVTATAEPTPASAQPGVAQPLIPSPASATATGATADTTSPVAPAKPVIATQTSPATRPAHPPASATSATVSAPAVRPIAPQRPVAAPAATNPTYLP